MECRSLIEQQKYLASRLTPDIIKENKVTILLGQASQVFKQIFTGDYHTLTSADDVKQFISDYMIPNDKPLVFEDLSVLTSQVQTYLLKFIEEPPTPLVILASKDNISPIILSRCKSIIKLPNTLKRGNQNITTFINNYEEDIINNKLTSDQVYSKCPDYLYYETQTKQDSHKSKKTMLKYISLLN